MSALSVNHLCKTFKDFTAIEDITFDINHGEVVALLGSNGAGKSTILNIIAGILKPTSGEVTFSGKNYENNYKEIRNQLGFLTCDMALYESLSIRETLVFLGKLKGFTAQQITSRLDELIYLFSLHEVIDKRFLELSSGQKQRSLVAAAVIHDPDILIFDEVTASLDLVISKGIMDFLKSEKQKGKAVIFSTHILNEVEYLSDRIIMIEKGKIIEETTCSQLLEQSDSPNLTEAFYRKLVNVQSNQ